MSRLATPPDGVPIAYEVAGDGPPVVLIHGFGANRAITWRNPNWFDWLTKAGRRVIALDCRGHGESGKPHRAEDYDDRRMLGDVLAVLDSAGAEQADVIGYSMGGYIAINLLHEAPQRIRRAVTGGVGETYFRFWDERSAIIAEALLAPDPSTIADAGAREYRAFCERAGDDLQAMAACMRRSRLSFGPRDLKTILHPVLIVCGALDETSGRPEALAECFAEGRAVVVPRRNHHSTVGDRLFKEAARDFLDRA